MEDYNELPNCLPVPSYYWGEPARNPATAFAPDLSVLNFGVNDWFQGETIDRFREKLVDAVTQFGSVGRVLLTTQLTVETTLSHLKCSGAMYPS